MQLQSGATWCELIFAVRAILPIKLRVCLLKAEKPISATGESSQRASQLRTMHTGSASKILSQCVNTVLMPQGDFSYLM